MGLLLPRRRPYRQALMGLLRFILAISVVIAHTSPIFGLTLVGGQLAVQSFYMISGFYMALILSEKYIGKKNSYKLFITNRLLRLFPIYWVVLLLVIFYSLFAGIYTNGADFASLQSYLTYLDSAHLSSFVFLIFANIFILFQDAVMFLGLNIDTGHLFFTSNFTSTSPRLHDFLLIPQAWTISIEIAFYLIAPFLVRRKLRGLTILITLSLLLRFFQRGSSRGTRVSVRAASSMNFHV